MHGAVGLLLKRLAVQPCCVQLCALCYLTAARFAARVCSDLREAL